MSVQRLAIILSAVGCFVELAGPAAAEEKPKAQAETGGQTPTQPPSGSAARGAPGSNHPDALVANPQSQISPLPNGIQITNTLTVNPPAASSNVQPAASPAPVIINTPNASSGSPGGSPEPWRGPPAGELPRDTMKFKHERHVRVGLLAAGATLFATSYVLTIVAAASVDTDCDPGAAPLGCTTARWPLFIPVAGPFLQMGYLQGNNDSTARALLAIDGVLQGGGVAMALVGLLAQKKVAVPLLAAGRFRLSPYTAGAGTGLVATSSF